MDEIRNLDDSAQLALERAHEDATAAWHEQYQEYQTLWKEQLQESLQLAKEEREQIKGQGEEMGALSMEVTRQRRTLATMETHRESFVAAVEELSAQLLEETDSTVEALRFLFLSHPDARPAVDREAWLEA